MSVVQVNDAEGRPFTKILSGETVEEAKKRITFEGILENSDGLALRNDETITEEGAPYRYIFKPRMQQQQQTTEVSLLGACTFCTVSIAFRNPFLTMYTLVMP
jgi:hypothetical protein